MAATGSSILEVSKGQADLSRRAITYFLPGLSFREFLELSYRNIFPVVTLETIISQHHDIAADYNDMLNIEKAFREYLRYGYYPFFDEGKKFYGQKLLETTNLVLDEVLHNVTSSRFGDFTIDDTYTFEIGGPSKTREQIRGVPDAYIAADGIKGGSGNKIPLWLFGFLY